MQYSQLLRKLISFESVNGTNYSVAFQVTGLFKGMASPLAGQTFINGCVFGVYSESYRRLNDLPYSIFWAGCVAGVAQGVITAPLELAKIRLQIQGEGMNPRKMTRAVRSRLKYTGSIHCLWKVFRTEGPRGISKGMFITLVREIPASGVYFYSYDELCKFGPRSEIKDQAKPLTVLVAGGIAGILSWVVIYPCDVIKSRYQADIKGIYESSRDCAVKSYRAEGWRMFFQGINSTIIRAFPTNAATFGVVVLFARLVCGAENDMW